MQEADDDDDDDDDVAADNNDDDNDDDDGGGGDGDGDGDGDRGKGKSVVGSAVENMRSSRSCDEDEGEAEVAGDDALTSGGATTVERWNPMQIW